MDILQGQAAWTSRFTFQRHAAWTFSIDMANGHAAQTYNRKMHHGHAARKYSISMQQIHVARTCSMVQLVHAALTSTLEIQQCTFMLHVHDPSHRTVLDSKLFDFYVFCIIRPYSYYSSLQLAYFIVTVFPTIQPNFSFLLLSTLCRFSLDSCPRFFTQLELKR
jgi:hypothetical protein